MHHESRLAHVSDDDLLRRLSALLGDSRRIESDLVAHIGEVDGRHLYAREASPSMFAYCTEVLHLSEAEAYLRIAAARAAREHPIILDMLGDGRLHLSGIAKLAPHLSPETGAELLARAAHRSKRQIQELVAEIAPRPDVPTIVRKLPTKAATPVAGKLGLTTAASAPNDVFFESPSKSPFESTSQSPSESAPIRQLRPDGVGSTVTSPRAHQVEPLAPDRYKVQFTASAELRDKLERLQELMRSQVPSGDLAAVIENIVTEKLERLERKRFAVTKAPRVAPAGPSAPPAGRYLPAALRYAVYKRDGGRCRFVDKNGRRCSERDRLEYHHRHPYGVGGDASLRNICLMCATHNLYLAELDYGRVVMSRHRSHVGSH